MKNQDIQTEAIGTWMNKSGLEKALSTGLHGNPELKRDEKIHYLGEFKERVIRMLTKKQVAESIIYPEIIEALKDERASKMIINGDIDAYLIEKYEKLARELDKHCTVIHDTKLKGEVGLVVVGRDAVDVEEINVMDREIRLSKLGLSKALINAAGKKVCSHCFNKIINADPGEAINYLELTWSDRLMGEHCEGCKSK